MASANPKWAGWIFATYHKVLRDYCAALTPALPIAVYPIDEITEAFIGNRHRLEVNISGPFVNEIQSGVHRVDLGVFAVLTSHAPSPVNARIHIGYAGSIQNALDRCIDIRQYEENGSEAYVGTMDVNPVANDRVRVTNLRPDTAEKTISTAIEARYTAHFQQGS